MSNILAKALPSYVFSEVKLWRFNISGPAQENSNDQTIDLIYKLEVSILQFHKWPPGVVGRREHFPVGSHVKKVYFYKRKKSMPIVSRLLMFSIYDICVKRRMVLDELLYLLNHLKNSSSLTIIYFQHILGQAV